MRPQRTELSPAALGYATGTISAVLFTLCALSVAIAPRATVASIAFMLHLDLTGLVRPVTWSGYAAGLLCITIGTALAFAAASALYNRFVRGLQATAREDLIGHRTA